MATTFNLGSSYAGEKAAGYISAALLSGNTLQNELVTVKPNVKYREVMRPFSISDDLIAPSSCDFAATSDITVAERYLDPVHLQTNLQLCKNDFINDWEAMSMGMSANQSVPGEFSDFLIQRVGAKVASAMETKIWSDNSTTGDFDGFGTIVSASAATGDSAYVAPATVDSSNVLDELQKIVDATDERLLQSEDFKIYASTGIVRAYNRALGGFGANGFGAAGTGNLGTNRAYAPELLYNGIQVCSINGLAQNTMIGAQKSNLAFGTGLLADHNQIQLIDMAPIDGSQNFRYVMRYTAGVQVGILGDVVYYGA